MFFQFISYLKFLLKSTNQHGVHSPFVFDFVTKGLYKKGVKNKNFNEYHQLKNLSKKKKKILSRITHFFKIETIFFDELVFKSHQEKNYKILYIKNLNKKLKLNTSKIGAKHIILIDGIHQNKLEHLNWAKIRQQKNITVSIDLFYFGLLFFRKEQAKEHFTIRV